MLLQTLLYDNIANMKKVGEVDGIIHFRVVLNVSAFWKIN